MPITYNLSQSRKRAGLRAISLLLLLSFSPQNLALGGQGGQAPLAPKTPKTIYLVQDAHSNLSGQKNVATIIHNLALKEKVKTVYLEAGSGDESLSFLRGDADPERLKIAAISFLTSGRLRGFEFANLTSTPNLTLWGVEDMELYAQSLSAYQRVSKERGRLSAYLDRSVSAAETLKSSVYGAALLSFDQTLAGLKIKNDPENVIRFISGEAVKAGIDLKKYPHLRVYVSLKKLETRINFENANREQIEAAGRLDPSDLAAFKQSKSSKDSGAFVLFLSEKLGREMSKYPTLSLYARYEKRAAVLRSAAFVLEVDALESRLYERFAASSDEKKLLQASRDLTLLKKMIALTLTPDEYAEYLSRRDSMEIERITGFLNKKIVDLKKFYEKAVFLEGGYADSVKICEEFYSLTLQRDEQFVANTLAGMEGRGENKAILIAGGFHAPNLKRLFAERNVTVVSIVPRIEQETNLKKYESQLLGPFAGHLGKSAAVSTHTSMPVGLLTRDALGGPDGIDFCAAIHGARLSAKDLHKKMRQRSSRLGLHSGARLADDGSSGLTLEEAEVLTPVYDKGRVSDFFDDFDSLQQSNPTFKWLIAARHMESTSNLFDIVQSYITFSPPTLLGLLQRFFMVRFLRSKRVRFDRVIASDLERASSLAAPVAAQSGLKVEVKQRAREVVTLPFGGISKHLVAQVREEQRLAFVHDPEAFETPGYKGRIFMKYAKQLFHEDIPAHPAARTFLATHGMTIVFSLHYLFGIPALKYESVFKKVGNPPNVGLSVFSYDILTRRWKSWVYSDNSFLPQWMESRLTWKILRPFEVLYYYGFGVLRLGLRLLGHQGHDQPDYFPLLWPLMAPSNSQIAVLNKMGRRTTPEVSKTENPEGARLAKVDAMNVEENGRAAQIIERFIRLTDQAYLSMGLDRSSTNYFNTLVIHRMNGAVRLLNWHFRLNYPSVRWKHLADFETNLTLSVNVLDHALRYESSELAEVPKDLVQRITGYRMAEGFAQGINLSLLRKEFLPEHKAQIQVLRNNLHAIAYDWSVLIHSVESRQATEGARLAGSAKEKSQFIRGLRKVESDYYEPQYSDHVLEEETEALRILEGFIATGHGFRSDGPRKIVSVFLDWRIRGLTRRDFEEMGFIKRWESPLVKLPLVSRVDSVPRTEDFYGPDYAVLKKNAFSRNQNIPVESIAMIVVSSDKKKEFILHALDMASSQKLIGKQRLIKARKLVYSYADIEKMTDRQIEKLLSGARGARLAEDVVRPRYQEMVLATHFTSLDNARMIVRHGFYGEIEGDVGHFELHFNELNRFTADQWTRSIRKKGKSPVVLVFRIPEMWLEVDPEFSFLFRYMRLSASTKVSEVPQSLKDELLSSDSTGTYIGNLLHEFNQLAQWEYLGHIPSAYIDLDETIRHNLEVYGDEFRDSEFNTILNDLKIERLLKGPALPGEGTLNSGARLTESKQGAGKLESSYATRIWPDVVNRISPVRGSFGIWATNLSNDLINRSAYGGWIRNKITLNEGSFTYRISKSLSSVIMTLFSDLALRIFSSSGVEGVTFSTEWPNLIKKRVSFSGIFSSARNSIDRSIETAQTGGVLGSSRIRLRNEERRGHDRALIEDNNLDPQSLLLLRHPLEVPTRDKQVSGAPENKASRDRSVDQNLGTSLILDPALVESPEMKYSIPAKAIPTASFLPTSAGASSISISEIDRNYESSDTSLLTPVGARLAEVNSLTNSDGLNLRQVLKRLFENDTNTSPDLLRISVGETTSKWVDFMPFIESLFDRNTWIYSSGEEKTEADRISVLTNDELLNDSMVRQSLNKIEPLRDQPLERVLDWLGRSSNGFSSTVKNSFAHEASLRDYGIPVEPEISKSVINRKIVIRELIFRWADKKKSQSIGDLRRVESAPKRLSLSEARALLLQDLILLQERARSMAPLLREAAEDLDSKGEDYFLAHWVPAIKLEADEARNVVQRISTLPAVTGFTENELQIQLEQFLSSIAGEYNADKALIWFGMNFGSDFTYSLGFSEEELRFYHQSRNDLFRYGKEIKKTTDRKEGLIQHGQQILAQLNIEDFIDLKTTYEFTRGNDNGHIKIILAKSTGNFTRDDADSLQAQLDSLLKNKQAIWPGIRTKLEESGYRDFDTFMLILRHNGSVDLWKGSILPYIGFLERWINNVKEGTGEREKIIHFLRARANFMEKGLKDDEVFIDLLKNGEKFQRMDVGPLIKERVEFHRRSAETKGLAFEFSFDEGEFIAKSIDRNLLKLVVDNLVQNAIKYTNQGTINIRLYKGEFEPFGRGGGKEQGVLFSVSDTGIGVPKDEQIKIFVRGKRSTNVTDQPGDGIGLDFVYTALNVMGGDIKLESEVGKGSNFTVFLTQPKSNAGPSGARLATEDQEGLERLALELAVSRSESELGNEIAVSVNDRNPSLFRVEMKRDEKDALVGVRMFLRGSDEPLVDFNGGVRERLRVLQANSVSSTDAVRDAVLTPMNVAAMRADIAMPAELEKKTAGAYGLAIPIGGFAAWDDDRFGAQIRLLLRDIKKAKEKSEFKKAIYYLEGTDAFSAAQQLTLRDEILKSGLQNDIQLNGADKLSGIVIRMAATDTDEEPNMDDNALIFPVSGIQSDALLGWYEVLRSATFIATALAGQYTEAGLSRKDIHATSVPIEVFDHYNSRVKHRVTDRAAFADLLTGRMRKADRARFSFYLPILERVPTDLLIAAARLAVRSAGVSA